MSDLYNRNKQALQEYSFWSTHYHASVNKVYAMSDHWSGKILENSSPRAAIKEALVMINFLRSGWKDFLEAKSMQETIVISDLAFREYESMIAPCPAFHQGKICRLILGTSCSADTCKMYFLQHPGIPQVALWFKAPYVHALMRYREPLRVLENVYGDKTLPHDRVFDLARQSKELYEFLAANNYSVFGGYFVEGGRVLALPYLETSRVRMNEDASLAPVVRTYLKMEVWPDRYTVGYLVSDQEFRALDDIKKPHLVQLPPEYEVPELKEVSLQLRLGLGGALSNWSIFRFDKLATNFFNNLEITLALIGKGINTMWAHEAGPFDLQYLGYLRTSLGTCLTYEQMQKYVAAIQRDPDWLLKYQQIRKAHCTELSSETRYKPSEGLAGGETVPITVSQYLPNVGPETHKQWAPYFRGNTFPSEKVPSELPAPEAVPEPPQEPNISIHGVELDADTMQRIFYNTPLATAVEYGTREYEPVYMNPADALLLQDFLEGRIMFLTLYKELSYAAYTVLAAPGTLLAYYEWQRLALDNCFELGAGLREQMKNASIARDMPSLAAIML